MTRRIVIGIAIVCAFSFVMISCSKDQPLGQAQPGQSSVGGSTAKCCGSASCPAMGCKEGKGHCKNKNCPAKDCQGSMCEAKADCGNKSCCEDSAAKCSEKQLKDATEADMAVAPDFTLMDHNGNEVALSDYEDKIVVLEWFNYECPFVVPEYEAGTQKALAEKYAEDGVVWLAINSTSHAKQEMNKEWVNKYDLPFAILDDSSGEVGRKYGATNTPHIFIINKDGHIVYEGAINNATRAVKPDEGFEAYADNALEAVVNGKEVPTDKTKPIGCTVKYAK